MDISVLNSETAKNIISHLVYDVLIEKGVNQEIAEIVNFLSLSLGLGLLLYLSDVLTRKVLIDLFSKFAAKTKTQFDDFLLVNKVTHYVGHVITVIIFKFFIPIVFVAFPDWVLLLLKVTDVYLVLLVVWIVRAVLRAVRDYLRTIENFRDKPIESYTQVIVIVVYFIASILIFSELTGKSVWTFITALGAASAVLLLIFKDTILGFVASIQVSINDMVRIGDWITMEKFGADGDVIEINLTTVKVQNFDKTITTIPTYSLISDSFKNWRGMSQAGGRRIKRSINIKISSIRFLSDTELEEMTKIQLLTSYIHHRSKDIREHNERNEIDKSVLINGRNLTNIGLYRKYVDQYISNHPAIHKEMTLMTRQLAPTEKGLPIEIYTFSADVRWVNYEHIMADIFDHLISAIPYFKLEVFELPSSGDLKQLNLLKNEG
jgi:miniconductance mechanosensitive channel